MGMVPPATSSAPSAIKLTEVFVNTLIIYPTFHWRDTGKNKISVSEELQKAF